ncbi:MAG: UPF0149 family protein [Granulosicoccus sp.]
MNYAHQNIGSSLSLLNVPLPTSEVHGLCCGLLCAQPSGAAKTRWFTEVLDSASLSPAQVAGNAAPLKLLDAWFGQTLSSMNDADLEFTPTLPDEDVPVLERLRALGDFCAGFTYGIGLTMAQRGNRPLPKDTLEIIEDFQAIDAADPADQADDDGAIPSADQQETMYVELLEYVRVGVLLVLEELRPISPTSQEKLS